MRTMLMAFICAAGPIVGCCGSASPRANAAPANVQVSGAEATTMTTADPMQTDGWALVPRANYAASQTPGEVIIVARGEAPSGGYEVKFVPSMLRIYPPQHSLYWKKPTGPATMAFEKFEVKATFKASDPIASVLVTDGSGRHEVKVDQARD